MKLNKQEKAIANFLENYHRKSNPIKMDNLAGIFGMTEREIRKAIERIILAQRLVIASSENGYWVAASEEEFGEANNLQIKRLKASLKRLRANKGGIGWLYPFLKEIEKEYPVIASGQIELELEEA